MIELIGAIAFLYILMGAVMVGRDYERVKDVADHEMIPRWYAFVSKVMLWLPDRILRKRAE